MAADERIGKDAADQCMDQEQADRLVIPYVDMKQLAFEQLLARHEIELIAIVDRGNSVKDRASEIKRGGEVVATTPSLRGSVRSPRARS